MTEPWLSERTSHDKIKKKNNYIQNIINCKMKNKDTSKIQYILPPRFAFLLWSALDFLVIGS